MELSEALFARHSVRQYDDRPLSDDIRRLLEEEIAACNAESGMRIRLVADEPKAFDCMLAHYGKFKGVRNYFAMVGAKDAEEACGYYGERLVLRAQQLGLNTCWVAASYKKVPSAYEVGEGEKLHMVIAVGYGLNEGKPHKSKSAAEVSDVKEDSPEWFKRGVEAALAAPTAINQQKFAFTHDGNVVEAKAGKGFYVRTDLGIAKYNFEVGAGKENFRWKA